MFLLEHQFYSCLHKDAYVTKLLSSHQSLLLIFYARLLFPNVLHVPPPILILIVRHPIVRIMNSFVMQP